MTPDSEAARRRLHRVIRQAVLEARLRGLAAGRPSAALPTRPVRVEAAGDPRGGPTPHDEGV